MDQPKKSFYFRNKLLVFSPPKSKNPVKFKFIILINESELVKGKKGKEYGEKAQREISQLV